MLSRPTKPCGPGWICRTLLVGWAVTQPGCALFFGSTAPTSAACGSAISCGLDPCAPPVTGVLPIAPLPTAISRWQAKWQSEQDLPEAPAYPRFHPLPTRPVLHPEHAQ